MLPNTAIVLLEFPEENEPACLPGPSGLTAWIGGRHRRKVERRNGTVIVWTTRAELETWMLVNEAVKDASRA